MLAGRLPLMGVLVMAGWLATVADVAAFEKWAKMQDRSLPIADLIRGTRIVADLGSVCFTNLQPAVQHAGASLLHRFPGGALYLLGIDGADPTNTVAAIPRARGALVFKEGQYHYALSYRGPDGTSYSPEPYLFVGWSSSRVMEDVSSEEVMNLLLTPGITMQEAPMPPGATTGAFPFRVMAPHGRPLLEAFLIFSQRGGLSGACFDYLAVAGDQPAVPEPSVP